MKRRSFFRRLGAGAAAGLLLPSLAGRPGFRPYPQEGRLSLADATNAAGEVALRLAFRREPGDPAAVDLRVRLKGPGQLARSQGFDFEGGDHFQPDSGRGQLHLPVRDEDVLVLWLAEVQARSVLEVRLGRESHSFALHDLTTLPEIRWQAAGVLVTANLLGYREIGYLDPATLGIRATGERVRLAIVADPQGGDPGYGGREDTTRMQIHNAYIAESVALVNALDPAPAFTLVLGDFTDHQGEEAHFHAMERLFRPLQSPLLLAIGNHESAYRSTFGPGYDFRAFAAYFASQHRLNGTDKLLYAFDLGGWHFIVWPDPLRQDFWRTHPHYFDWLAQDLAQHRDQPVMFFQHVPSHPIGIDPLLSYVETVAVRRTLVDILSRHGNVRYVFSGHVHIPVKASVKTAVTLRGMHMINLPAAGYRPRAFGEPDFFGGPEQGIVVIDIEGEKVNVAAQTVSRHHFTYPDTFPPFDEGAYPLWLGQPWELPAATTLQNGDFHAGLAHWHQRYIYPESANRSHYSAVRPSGGGPSHLYQQSRCRPYPAPGQDRMPQTLNRICQAVTVAPDALPGLRLRYRIDPRSRVPDSLNSPYLWLAFYRETCSVAHLVYAPGRMFYNLTGQFGEKRDAPLRHFDLPARMDIWHTVSLDPAADYAASHEGASLAEAAPDRLVIHLGTWTINDGLDQMAAWEVAELALVPPTGGIASSKAETQFWYGSRGHVAGEHDLAAQADLFPPHHLNWETPE